MVQKYGRVLNSWLLRFWIGVASVLAVPVGMTAQSAEQKPVVAVFDIAFEDFKIDTVKQKQLTKYLGYRLVMGKVYQVIPEGQLKEAMVALKIESQKDCYDEMCRVKLGNEAAANKNLNVTVWKVGSRCSIIGALYDLRAAASEEATEVQDLDCSVEGLKAGIEKFARQLGGKAAGNTAVGGSAGVVSGVPADGGVVGGGTVTHGIKVDRGESIENAMTDQKGVVFITTDPPRATLYINGREYGAAPYQDELMVGRYVVTATLNSYYHDAAQEIQLTTEGARVNLVLPPAFGTLRVTSTPSDSEVLIDDKPVGRTPYTDARMKSGEYRVEVRRDLYRSATTSVKILDGMMTDQALNLSADFGSLEIRSTPSGASILMDGQATGRVTPATFAQVGSGLHIVTLDLDGYGRQVENVKMTAGGSQRVDALLEAKMGRVTVMTLDEDGAPCIGTISIDGKPMGETPWKGDLIALSHTVEAKCGDGVKSEVVVVEHNVQKTLKLQMEPSNGIRWVRLPGGTFQMGSTGGDGDEKPVHSVTLSAFEMAATEVTVGQYRKCVDAGACSSPHFDDGTCFVYDGSGWSQGVLPQSFRGDNQPVVCVDWNQASAYAKWVGGRLPTEAEWEYAARSGGKNQQYPWGDQTATCSLAIMDDGGLGCGRTSTWPVCSKVAGNSAQGLCDMAGNVWEWVSDWYGKYGGGSVTKPTGPSSGSYRVYRGGSWYSDADSVRAAHRGSDDPGGRGDDLGFRPARDAL